MPDSTRKREIFEACLALPAHQREERLRTLCGSDHALYRHVGRLLRAHEGSPDLDSVEAKTSSRGDESTARFCPSCQTQLPGSEPERCPACELACPLEGWPADRLLGREVAGGQYRVLRRLGAGGFGVVYEVETVVGGLRRALKVLKDAWAGHDQVRERFINEALLVEEINHPNVARCYAVGTLDQTGGLYLLFEFIAGLSLSQLISDAPGGLLPPQRAVRIARQIAAGLAAAHAKRVLHRDLKPANVLVVDAGSAREQVKLLDFGIAKLLETDATSSGHLVGTPAYMAPEQFRVGTPVGIAVDLWQLGATLFTMLVGRPPYAESEESLDLDTLFGRYHPPGTPGPAPSSILPSLAAHPLLDTLVSRLLATDPVDRPESAALVCEELARIEHALSPGSAATRPALLDALCSQPSFSSWSALCRYLATQDESLRQLAEERLSEWPLELRGASLAWWEEVRRGRPHVLWPLARSLDLSARGLTDEDVVRISRTEALLSLRRLNLSGNNISAEGIESLVKSPLVANIEYLDLSGNRLGGAGLAAVARSSNLHRLRTLLVRNNRLDRSGLEALARSELRLRELDLSENDLGAEGAEALAQGGLRELQSLVLSSCRIGPDGAAILAVSSLLAGLRVLDLRANALGPGGTAALAVSRGLEHLQRLVLAQNNIGRQGLQLVLSAPGLESLAELDLSSNGLGPNGAMSLAASPLGRRLRSLELGDNQIEDAGLAALLGSSQLTGLSTLGVSQNGLTASGIGLLEEARLQIDDLDLSDNPLGARGAARLRAALPQMRVRRLVLSRCELTADDVAELVDNHRGSLVHLGLAGNRLGFQGILQLARSPQLASLSSLDLDDTWTGSEAVRALVSSPFLVNLTTLSAASNSIGDQGMAEVLQGNGLNMVHTLNLQDNGIGPEGAAALAAAPLATRLRKVDLSFNRLGDAGVEALARGQNWRQLQELRLRDNDLGFAGASALAATTSMEMLQVLDLRDNPLLGAIDLHSLSRNRIELLEESFARISANSRVFAERFYEHLFHQFPAVKPLFAGTVMSRQQQHLFSALAMVIENLRRPDSVEAGLRELARRHVGYGVKPSHYQAVTGCLLTTFHELLVDDWSDELHTAWSEGLEAVSRVMIAVHLQSRREFPGDASAPTGG